ncbi:MAG: hypothetical protein ACOX1Z_00005, partial [Candidatus Ratteibacteria bacterium]
KYSAYAQRCYQKSATGGDVTRKNKLLEKQKEGKTENEENRKVNVHQDVFLSVLQMNK